MMNLELVARTLAESGVRYALIGAVALAARGASRSTLDIDLMTTDRRVLDPSLWSKSGLTADVRKGDFDDPLAGVVRISGDEPIDIVVAKYKWQRDVVERAEPISLRGLEIRVPSVQDLILLKLFAGGYLDFNDIRTLLAIGPREQLIADVDAAIETLPDDMRARWQKFLREIEG